MSIAGGLLPLIIPLRLDVGIVCLLDGGRAAWKSFS